MKPDGSKAHRDILERMAIGMKKSSHELHQNVLGLLLEKSRLLYSGVTIKLFNRITSINQNKHLPRTETISEDDEFNISMVSENDFDTKKKQKTFDSDEDDEVADSKTA